MSPATQMRLIRRVKPVVFLLCLVPLGWQIWRLYSGDVIDPVEEFTEAGGQWSLRFLFATLAITPIRILTGFGAIVSLRRMLGLFTFFYACIHFGIFVGIDHFFDWPAIVEDITERRYVIAGATGLCLMIPLAATSFNRAIKALGSKNWQLLHRLVYVVAIAAMLHFFWLVKTDYTEPLLYAITLAAFFLIRLVHWGRRTARRQNRTKKSRSKAKSHSKTNASTAHRQTGSA